MNVINKYIQNNSLYDDIDLQNDGLVIYTSFILNMSTQEEECHGIKSILFADVEMLECNLVYVKAGKIYSQSIISDTAAIEDYLLANMDYL